MKIYNSFSVYYQQEPFVNIIANDQKDVEQFIMDWCQGNQIRPNADEWLIRPVDAIVTKESMNEMMQEGGGGGNIIGNIGGTIAKGQAVPGLLKVKINPKCWG